MLRWFRDHSDRLPRASLLARAKWLKRAVTHGELSRESARIRDIVADVECEMARLAARVHELERQMREWKEHLT